MNTQSLAGQSAAKLCICVLMLAGLIAPARAARRPPPLSVEGGALVNTRAQYYFVVPDGWALDAKSDYRHVVLVHALSNSSFTVSFKRAPDFDLQTEYRYLFNALTLSGIRSVRGAGDDLTLDGRPAMSLTYELPKAGDQMSQWLVRDGEVAFELMATIPKLQLETMTPHVGQIIRSFKWGKPEKQP